MKPKGQVSRVLNQTLSPVTHPALPRAAAPGQMSVADIMKTRSLLGLSPSKRYCLFGSPISLSPSPALHNAGFKYCGLTSYYDLCETTDIEVVKTVLGRCRSLFSFPLSFPLSLSLSLYLSLCSLPLSHDFFSASLFLSLVLTYTCMYVLSPSLPPPRTADPNFGGASVTIPLKEQVLPLMDELSESAKKIGAVNTIHRREDGSLFGDNTDWIGIVAPSLSHVTVFPPEARGDEEKEEEKGEGKKENQSGVGVVIGAGGTARAAVFALQQLGFSGSNLCIVNPRTPSKAQTLAEEFGCLSSFESLSLRISNVKAVVVTLPGSVPYTLPSEVVSTKPLVVQAAYIPFHTSLSQQAEEHGCPIIRGIDMLVAQGVAAFSLWTGKHSMDEAMDVAARNHYEEVLKNL